MSGAGPIRREPRSRRLFQLWSSVGRLGLAAVLLAWIESHYPQLQLRIHCPLLEHTTHTHSQIYIKGMKDKLVSDWFLWEWTSSPCRFWRAGFSEEMIQDSEKKAESLLFFFFFFNGITHSKLTYMRFSGSISWIKSPKRVLSLAVKVILSHPDPRCCTLCGSVWQLLGCAARTMDATSAWCLWGRCWLTTAEEAHSALRGEMRGHTELCDNEHSILWSTLLKPLKCAAALFSKRAGWRKMQRCGGSKIKHLCTFEAKMVRWHFMNRCYGWFMSS